MMETDVSSRRRFREHRPREALAVNIVASFAPASETRSELMMEAPSMTRAGAILVEDVTASLWPGGWRSR
jgi:hypothetical protein